MRTFTAFNDRLHDGIDIVGTSRVFSLPCLHILAPTREHLFPRFQTHHLQSRHHSAVRATLPVSSASLRYKSAPSPPLRCKFLSSLSHLQSFFLSSPPYSLNPSTHTMLSKLGTKIALQRAGLGNVSLPSLPKNEGKSGEGGGFAVSNPFANVQWGKAFSSWQAPPPEYPVADPPTIGVRVANNPKLRFPTADNRPVVILFLRFCGCPCKTPHIGVYCGGSDES